MSLYQKTLEIFSRKKINQKDKTNNITSDNNYFCCPKCKEKILISLNPSNFSVSYNCENNHNETNLDYNFFYNKRYINSNNEILCQQCKKVKLNNNKIIVCNNCNIKLCSTCLIKHKNNYKQHKNFGIIYNSVKKCPKHDIDISQYCETCKKNLCTFCSSKNEEDAHLNHNIINFSELIPNEKEINNNKEKLNQKIVKNNSIIEKLKNWKQEMCSLIDELIYKLKSEKMIYKMIIQNFNWKNIDYINYKNYQMAVEKLDIKNEGLENFYNSKMFIEQTIAINEYLFGKNYYKNNELKIEDKKEEDKKINNEIKKEIEFNIINNNINNNKNLEKEKKIINELKKEIEFNIINNNINNNKNLEQEKKIINELKKGKALIYNKNKIISYSLDTKDFIKISENNNIKINKNNNNNIYDNLNELNINLLNKLGDYNIIIWKAEEDFDNDKLIKIIKNRYKDLKISDKNNFNFIKKDKSIINNNNIINNNESQIRRDSNDNLLFSESNNNNSLFGLGLNNNQNQNNPFYNQNNENTRIFTNFESSSYANNNIRQREERYVYISRTGSKYHGRPTCGRMKSSTRVALSKAEAMGLGPCMKCA